MRSADAPHPEDDAAAGPVDGSGDEPARDGDRLPGLVRRLGLTELDTAALLIALAPDLDRGFEPLYGYLNDDVSRRRATVGLVLDVCGLSAAHPGARARFHPSAPLAELGLLVVEEVERPFLSRALSVPDRLVAHLLGDDTQDAVLDGRVRMLPAPGEPSPDSMERLAEHLATAPGTVYLREQREGDGLLCAATALGAAGYEALHFTPVTTTGHQEHGPDDRRHDVLGPVPELLREARLRGCGIVVSPLPERPGPLTRALAAPDVPVLLTGRAAYDPQWCDHDPLVLDVPRLPSGGVDAWAAALGVGGRDDA
ncbi:putative AAA family ATPase, partial [Streptomyces himastatinicus ATCC 53653]